MRTRVLSRYFVASRSGRAVVLLTVAILVAVGLVLVGAGRQQWANAAVSPGTTQLVSVDQGTPSAASGQPAVSANGRYVAFATNTSLDPLDVSRGGASDLDVYVRDLQEQKTVLLSAGVLPLPKNVLWLQGLPEVPSFPADGPSWNPSISADGRYVAFQTAASNLTVQGNNLRSAVVVVDRDPDGNGVFDESNCAAPQQGCHQVTQVSTDGLDAQGRPLAGAGEPSISAAGDAVAWVGVSPPDETSSPAETPGYRGIPMVYRSILQKGPTGAVIAARSQQIAAKAEGLALRGESAPALSGDGRRLALVAEIGPQTGPGPTADARSAVLGVDLSGGPQAGSGNTVFAAVRLDVDENGSPLTLPPGFTAAPTMSGDGRLVAFTAPGAGSQLVRAVRWEAGQGPRSKVISTDTTGREVQGTDPALSANGRYLAYTTSARGTHNGVDGPDTTCGSGPAPGPSTTTPGPDLSVPSTSPLPSPIPGLVLPGLSLPILNPPDTPVPTTPVPGTPAPSTTTSGTPAPGTTAPGPTPLPSSAPVTGSHCDVVVRDLGLDAARAAAKLPALPAELASPSQTQDCGPAPAADATCEGDDASSHPAISADGGVVAYESKADDLIPQDRNGHTQDVFLRTFAPSLTADPLDFFVIKPGDSIIGSTTLHHVGFGPLVVESMTISGVHAAEYSVSPENCVGRTLQAGESCPVSVRFAPGAVGPREAKLEVRYRGSGSPLAVPVLGTAALSPPRVVTFTPNPLAFADKLPLSTNPPGDVTVKNTGNAPLTINAVSVLPAAGSQQPPEDYKITKDDCSRQTVPPGANCVVTVQFSPQEIGERPAVLRFDDNAPNGPHLLDLQGTGIQPRMQFDPAVVQAGRVTTLTGSGFAPGHPVTVRIPDVSNPITVATDGAGNFITSMVIYGSTVPGEHQAAATVDNHQPSITATARMRVVGRPAPPPGTNGGPR